jgi:hypothetical protein
MKKSRTNKLYKAAQKEIRTGQALFSPKEKQELAVIDKPTPREFLKEQPKKLAKKEKSIAQADINRMHIKKIKMKATHSKRTTPGEVDFQPSAPHNVHVEGQRWKHTVDNQSVNRSYAVDRKVARNKKK